MARKNLRRKLAHNGRTGRVALKSDFRRLKSVIGDATKHAKGNARKVINDSYGNLIDKSTDVQDSLITYTRRKPLKSLGFAVLAGLTIGFLFRR